jgi:hypothetical protein
MEIDLFPVPRLYGGGLYFRGGSAAEVLHAYRQWVRSVPDEMTSSVALVRLPLQSEAPAVLRGRFVTHVRIAFRGPAAHGERLVRPLRSVAQPLLDTLADMPYSAAGAIHADPVEPSPLSECSTYLRDLDAEAVDALVAVAGPDAACPLRLVEIRHLGGALARRPAVPNAVGHRDAAFLLSLAGSARERAGDEYGEFVLARMDRWSTGGAGLNFLGPGTAATSRVRAAFSREDYARLVSLKRAYDPENLFRVNHNIPPLPTVEPERDTPPTAVGADVISVQA